MPLWQPSQQRWTVFPCTVNIYESIYRTRVRGQGEADARIPTTRLRRICHSLPSQVTLSSVFSVSFFCFSLEFSPYLCKFWMNLLFAFAFLNLHKYCHMLVCGYALICIRTAFSVWIGMYVCSVTCCVCSILFSLCLLVLVVYGCLLLYFCRVHVTSCVSPGTHMQKSPFCMCLRRKRWALLSALLCCNWDLF